jgi:hypothetical protein
MTNTTPMTPATQKLFEMLCLDAPNWSGSPLIGGNFDFGKAERGNLSDLKKRGLVTSDGEYVDFTEAGIALARELGVWQMDPAPEQPAAVLVEEIAVVEEIATALVEEKFEAMFSEAELKEMAEFEHEEPAQTKAQAWAEFKGACEDADALRLQLAEAEKRCDTLYAAWKAAK